MPGLVRSPEVNGLRFISVCQVVVINGSPGTANGCVPVAARSAGSTWLLADVGYYQVIIASLGRPDFSFNLFYASGQPLFSLLESRALSSTDVLEAAERAIRSPPLLLRTHLSRYLLGTSPRRESLVIPGGFSEEVTVRIDVNALETHNVAGDLKTNYILEVSTAILVNRQKDSNNTSWHHPSQEQSEAWTEAVRRKLAEEMGRLCRRPASRDALSVVCE